MTEVSRGRRSSADNGTDLDSFSVFSTSGTWFTTDELYFSEREFGGLPWEKPENFSRCVVVLKDCRHELAN